MIQFSDRWHYPNLRFVILLAIIGISAFTHLWNLDGFPSIYRDEDHYLRKTLHVLAGLGPQEKSDELLSNPSHPYTHPYFGQLLLAAILGGIDYPHLINPSIDPSSIKEIYLAPRLIMGIFAIVDTFFLFKITERRYGTTIAVISSVLFAVMPLTWIIRRIWLEPIQLPFLLASLLVAMYLKDYISRDRIVFVLVTLSGILFGLTVFTKLPIFTLIPLGIYIIYSNTKNWHLVGTWILPVLLIPLLWPVFAIVNGEFDLWIDGLFWQSERGDKGILSALEKLFAIDPVLLILAFVGALYTIVKRDLLIILWFVPFILFNIISGYVSYWHFILLLPAFCTSSAIFMKNISILFRKKKIRTMLPYAIILTVGIYGFIMTIMLITLNLTSFHYQTVSNLAYQIQKANTISVSDDGEANRNKDGITVLGNNYWLWIPKYIFDRDGINNFRNYFNSDNNLTKKVIFVVGEDFASEMTNDKYGKDKLKELLSKSVLLNETIDNQSVTLKKNRYPFNSLTNLTHDPVSKIEIRANY